VQLVAANHVPGPDIGAETGRCLWDDTRLDLATAADGLMQADGRL
jgi:hypothetical protein